MQPRLTANKQRLSEPVEPIARLAALVQKRRAYLTCGSKVLCAEASLRAQVTPSAWGKRPPSNAASVFGVEPRRAGTCTRIGDLKLSHCSA